ncbi:DC-STAMP domain-containing protein 2 isoform X2 [Embiotoca jacksoni]|uniref:DC-STAMP domain-containing protein 2 isoform X2 n=1 Tax=Embiotoca jacksoni TaxID=100190 RepID=UPI003703EC2E
MKMSEERKRLLLKRDIIVQVEGGGATRTIRGVLNRSAGPSHLSSSRRVRGHLVEGGRSLLAFLCGLLLASLYGLAGLFLQKQPLGWSVSVTLLLAGLAAFGMGLSADIRVDVTLMLPSLCSGRGRNFLLLLFVSVLLSGPLANMLDNTERAAAGLLCGAELSANQTQELMQRAATPLFSVLDRIREISSNAHAVAGRVQNFLWSLMDSVRHVARTLRNVLHFLVDIGDICNAKLGAPYRKCRAVFADARSNCIFLLGDFRFLCNIMDAFLPLCELARAGELFCVIPSYIGRQLKQRLAAPTIAAFQKIKREFEFNISASVTFDLDANSSRSLEQVSQDIMKEVSSDLQVFQRLSAPLAYASLILLALSFLRAARYRWKYLQKIDFDNVYITSQFKELDQQVASRGGASVLPITRREAKTYITPMTFHPTDRERRAVFVGVVSVLRHLVIGSLLVALDFLVFWILDQVNHQVKGDIVAKAPVSVAVQVNGSGYASDIFRDLVTSFNVLQAGNVTVISRKCLPEPSEPDYTTCFLLGFMQRCRRIICSTYYPERELERIYFLRQKILDQRRAVGRALRRSAVRSTTDRGGGGGSHLQTVLTRLPGGSHLSHLLGLSAPVLCLSCGEEVKPENGDAVTYDGPHNSGLYCRPCFLNLGNTCAVCMRPLTFQEDSEEEHDADTQDQDRPGSDEFDSDTPLHSTTSAETSNHLDQILTSILIDPPDRPQNHPEPSRTFQDLPGPSRTLENQVLSPGS